MPEAFLASNNNELMADKKSILIIDDELSMRNALRRALHSTPFAILSAQDGFQAGVKIIAEKPDLIVLDLSLPGLNGFEVIQFIRERPELANIKILILSGLSPKELAESIRLGADDAIAKPFDNHDLLDRVNMLLS